MIDVEIRNSLIDFAVELMDTRTPDGSWHDARPTLQSIVVTCQATTWLAGVEGDLAEETVDDACRWLCKAETVALDYAYWRLIPLIYAGADAGAIAAARDHVRKAAEERVIHHRNSPLNGFYIDALNRLGVTDETYDRIVSEWSHDLDQPVVEWAPPRIGHVLGCIAANPAPFDAGYSARLVAQLRAVGTYDGAVRYWGSLVETAYVVKDLAACANQFDGRLQAECLDMAKEGARHLCTAWTRDELASPPIAGGDFDDTLYNHVVVARALSAVCDVVHPGWQSRAWANEFAGYRRSLGAISPSVEGDVAAGPFLALFDRRWRSALAVSTALAGVAAILSVFLVLDLDKELTWTIAVCLAALASVGAARALLGPERYAKPLKWGAAAIAFAASVAGLAGLLFDEDPKRPPASDTVTEPTAPRDTSAVDAGRHRSTKRP